MNVEYMLWDCSDWGVVEGSMSLGVRGGRWEGQPVGGESGGNTGEAGVLINVSL